MHTPFLIAADVLRDLIQREGREHEAAALEDLAQTWLQLIPVLIHACHNMQQSSTLLYDLFQVGISLHLH